MMPLTSSALLTQFITLLVKADAELEPIRQVLIATSSPAYLFELLKPAKNEHVTTTDISEFLSLYDTTSEYLAYLVLKSYDYDKDGKLKLSEFVEIIKPNKPRVLAKKRLSDVELTDLLRQLLKGEMALEETVEPIRKLMENDFAFQANKAFEYLTKASASHVTKEHLAAVFSMTPAESEAALRRLDKDKDGKVSFKEFEASLKPTAPKIKLQTSASSILRTPSPGVTKRKKGHANSVHFEDGSVKGEIREIMTSRKEINRLAAKHALLATQSAAVSPSSMIKDTNEKINLTSLKRIKKKPEALLSSGSVSTTQSDCKDYMEFSRRSPPLLPADSKLRILGEKLDPIRALTSFGLCASTSYSSKIDGILKDLVNKSLDLEKLRIKVLSDPNWNFAAAYSAFDKRSKNTISILDIIREGAENEVEISLTEAEIVVRHLTADLSCNLYFQHFKALLTPFDQKALRSCSRRKQDLNATLDPQSAQDICIIVKLFAELLTLADKLKSSVINFKRFSLSLCYASVGFLISKGLFMKVMTSLGIYSNVDTKVRLAGRKHGRGISQI
mmetsp:Transcript_27528/g.49634  ORF Transcript_27528/g.49634 Transcript_27528/m.49634 type:complete len:560 (-) Transcript_27528:2083-3762(-)